MRAELQALAYFWRYLDRNHVRWFVVIAVSSALLRAMVPVTVKLGIGEQGLDHRYFLVMAAMLAVVAVLALIASNLSLRLGLQLFHAVRVHVFEHTLLNARNVSRGMLLSRLTFNLGFVRYLLTTSLFPMIPAVLSLVLIAGITAVLYPRLAPIFLAYLAGMIVYGCFVVSFQRRYILQLHTTNAMLASCVDDLVTSKACANPFVYHPRYVERFGGLSARDVGVRYRRNWFYIVNHWVLQWSARIGHVLVLGFAFTRPELPFWFKTVLGFVYFSLVVGPISSILRGTMYVVPGLISLRSLHQLVVTRRPRQAMPMRVQHVRVDGLGHAARCRFDFDGRSKLALVDRRLFADLIRILRTGNQGKRLRLNGAAVDRVQAPFPENLALISRAACLNYGTLYQNVFLDDGSLQRSSTISEWFDDAAKLGLRSVMRQPQILNAWHDPSIPETSPADAIKIWLLRCRFSAFDLLIVDDVWSVLDRDDARRCAWYLRSRLADRGQLLIFDREIPAEFHDYVRPSLTETEKRAPQPAAEVRCHEVA